MSAGGPPASSNGHKRADAQDDRRNRRSTAIGRTLIGVGLLGILVVVRTLVAPGDRADPLQLRPVLAIAADGSSGWEALAPTCPSPPAACLELAADGEVVVEDAIRSRYRLGGPIVTGDDVAEARVVQSADAWAVEIRLRDEAVEAFASATAKLTVLPDPRNRLAILTDGVLASAAVVVQAIDDGRLLVTGDFTEASAKALATRLAG